MSNRLLRAAFMADCRSIAEKAVLVSLADMANDQGCCFPSIETTAARISADEKTVRRAVRQLVANGHLTISRRGRGFDYLVHPQSGQRVRNDSGQRVRSNADIPSEAEDTESGDSGQGVRSLRAESPPNHQEPSFNPQNNNPALRASAAVDGKTKKTNPNTAIADDWKPNADTIARLQKKGYRDLDERRDHFLIWARGAKDRKDWDAKFEKAVLEDWAKLGVPIDLEALNREVEERQRQADAREADRKARDQEESARLLAARPELAQRPGESFKDYLARTTRRSANAVDTT